MPEVSFYVLKSGGEIGRRQFACRLAEKAYKLSHTVHIATADSPTARDLDELLWTFRDGSFVPHELAAADAQAEAPVTIGPGPAAAERAPFLLINLDEDLPAGWEACERVAEIVGDDAESRQICRSRYARYRELGHTPVTHEL